MRRCSRKFWMHYLEAFIIMRDKNISSQSMLVSWHKEEMGDRNYLSSPVQGRGLDMILNLIMKSDRMGKEECRRRLKECIQSRKSCQTFEQDHVPFYPSRVFLPCLIFQSSQKTYSSSSSQCFPDDSPAHVREHIWNKDQQKNKRKISTVWHLLSFCRLHITHRSLASNLDWICVCKSVR